MSNSTKEFLYVGHYFDTDNNFILKIGTTKDLKERQKEHTKGYKKPTKTKKKYRMAETEEFVYDWFLPLSKYNTLRYEASNKDKWKEENIGEYIFKDRFKCDTIPQTVTVKIRKEYVVKIKVN